MWSNVEPTKDGTYYVKDLEENNEMLIAVKRGDTWTEAASVSGASGVATPGRFEFGPQVPSPAEIVAIHGALRTALIDAMEAWSEDRYSAGWMLGTERALWNIINDDSTQKSELTLKVAALSALTNGWVIWDEVTDDPKWIPMNEWRRAVELSEARSKELRGKIKAALGDYDLSDDY